MLRANCLRADLRHARDLLLLAAKQQIISPNAAFVGKTIQSPKLPVLSVVMNS